VVVLIPIIIQTEEEGEREQQGHDENMTTKLVGVEGQYLLAMPSKTYDAFGMLLVTHLRTPLLPPRAFASKQRGQPQRQTPLALRQNFSVLSPN